MFWVILIIVIVGVCFYSYKRDDYNDIYKDYNNRNNNASDEDTYTYFDDISDDDVEYDYLEREEQRGEKEDDYYINQRNK